MTTKAQGYIDLMLKLKAMRDAGKTKEEELESGITDELDIAWYALDGEEIEQVEQELKKVWPMEASR